MVIHFKGHFYEALFEVNHQKLTTINQGVIDFIMQKNYGRGNLKYIPKDLAN